ncbi:MAG: DUF2934 domain-containing protein [Terracidiphilus sp.]
MAETVKKTRTAAKPRKAASKSGNGVSAGKTAHNHHGAPQGRTLPYEEVARLAHSYWQQRGGQHGQHMDDWFRAEQDLRGRAA